MPRTSRWVTAGDGLDGQTGAPYGTNPELGGQCWRPALDRHHSLYTTDKTIMAGCRQHAHVTIHRGGAPATAILEGRDTGDAPGRPHETLLTAGQTAGGVKEILPVTEIMRRLVAETEAALSRAVDFR
jgi:NAD(P)H-dependent flavin oxidoreductase YrpB (nitropropane dioxygenase family)